MTWADITLRRDDLQSQRQVIFEPFRRAPNPARKEGEQMLFQFLAVLALAASPGTPQATAELADGVKLQVGGQPIDVEIGHAAPCYTDFDGDGTKDLLVGQFGGGKLRIYKNSGTNTQPRFEGFTFFQAGGADATVPFG
jgi:hypothetical protein